MGTRGSAADEILWDDLNAEQLSSTRRREPLVGPGCAVGTMPMSRVSLPNLRGRRAEVRESEVDFPDERCLRGDRRGGLCEDSDVLSILGRFARCEDVFA